MGHHGEAFGTDLYELEKIARDDLPSVANLYTDAIAKCNQALNSASSVMNRSGDFGGGTLGPVFDSYRSLHDVMMGVFQKTNTNLHDSATAIDQTAQAYAKADREAAQAFDRIMSETPPEPGR